MEPLTKHQILASCLDNIEFTQTNGRLVQIYVALGSALSPINYRNGGDWYVPPENNQQYPPFIDQVKNYYHDVDTHIILIDPEIENPPYITQCEYLNLDKNQWCVQTYKSKKVYFNKMAQTTVYTISYSIDFTDDIDFFNDLNMRAINNGWFVVVHDFIGFGSMTHLAFQFDETVKDHLNHIIYCLDLRKDSMCYINLDSNISKFYFISKKSIRVFNPYYYHINKLYRALYLFVKANDNPIVREQYETFVELRKNKIVEHVVRLLRQTHLLEREYNDVSLVIEKVPNTLIDDVVVNNMKACIENRDFGKLYFHAVQLFYRELDNICTILGHEIINIYYAMNVYNEMITKNVYKWKSFVDGKLRELNVV